MELRVIYQGILNMLKRIKAYGPESMGVLSEHFLATLKHEINVEQAGSMPEERRTALDLLDVRESMEAWGDVVRWIPTDTMLVDPMTKRMQPDILRQALQELRPRAAVDNHGSRGRPAA